jgi:hypothetical protein
MTGSPVEKIVVEPNQQPLNKGMQWLVSETKKTTMMWTCMDEFHFDGVRVFASGYLHICHMSRTWVHFRLIRQSNWTEGGRLKIFATLLGAIDAI